MGDSLKGEAGVLCQVCGKTWPQGQSVCPDDGNWLHEETIMEAQRRQRGPSMGDQFEQDSIEPRRAVERTAPRGGPSDELRKGTKVGDYVVESKIGEGAMGTVYRAVHPAIGRHVAIKVMTPKVFDDADSEKRFVAEARAVAAIRHPGIVDVFGFGRLPDDRTYLVMEWLDGTSLAARLAQGKVSFDEACDMLRQIARALEAAHAKGVIHRDLKPENVFVHLVDDEKPQCKLLDFGLAKMTKKEDAHVARTRTGQLLGTPLYMSPEQCKAKGVDHRTDIYALGCMAYEMLCGRVPFDCDSIAELISAHLVADPPKPSSIKPGISPALDELLLRMVAKNPDERPTLAEVRRSITSVLTDSSQALPVPPAPTHPTPVPFSLGSHPAIVLPPVEPSPPAVQTLAPPRPEPTTSQRGLSPWVAILSALAIIAVALAVFAAFR